MVQLIASLTMNENEPEALQAYFDTVNPLVESVGGKILQTINVGPPVVGQTPSKMVMLVEYPSRDSINQVFESEEYKAIIPVRKLAFNTYNICFIEDSTINVKIGFSEISMPFAFE